MQHAPRKPRVQRPETDSDLPAEQLVTDTGDAVGILQQTVKQLREKQQRAAAELVRDKVQCQWFYFRQFLHGFVKLETQALGSPAGYAREITERLHVGIQLHRIRIQRCQRLSQLAYPALIDHAGTIGGLACRSQQIKPVTPGHLRKLFAQLCSGCEIRGFNRKPQVDDAQPGGRVDDAWQGIAQVCQQLRRNQVLMPRRVIRLQRNNFV